jgi:MoaA/NifB/PqqE/SkfB family radical SAM enzyme
MQFKKYFCYEIYKNLAIWSKNGNLNYNPCSFYSGYIKTTTEFNLDTVWNSPEHNQLKTLIDNDLPVPGCSACYKAERVGLESRRQGAKNSYETFFKDTNIDLTGPQSIDYSVGNLCNLKCIICGPSNSSAWLPDWQKLYPLDNITQYKFDKFNQIEVNDVNLLKNVINVHFHGGGEPLISCNHINLLKSIKQVKGLGDVRVFYNTNGTTQVTDEVLELWGECRLVELYFSIDDIGERFEYQRTGANWQNLINNLIWFKKNLPPNHMFKINCTWSYLNLFYLNHLVDWYENNFKTNRLGDVNELIFQKAIGIFAINSASNKTIDYLLDKFNQYPQLSSLVNSINRDDSASHGNFLNYIEKIDQIRKSSFLDICTEWAQLLTSGSN